MGLDVWEQVGKPRETTKMVKSFIGLCALTGIRKSFYKVSNSPFI